MGGAVSPSGGPLQIELRTEWSIMKNMMSTQARKPRSPAASQPGRPRTFEPAEALREALEVFWQKGYEATSLDDLTSAMRLSRSSFYACFGSKHATLMAALQSYADTFYATISDLATSKDAHQALHEVLASIVDVEGGQRGCFLVNSIVERAPHDPELARYAREHLDRTTHLVSALVERTGVTRVVATERAAAALATCMGAVMLRKAGAPPSRLQSILQQAKSVATAQQ